MLVWVLVLGLTLGTNIPSSAQTFSGPLAFNASVTLPVPDPELRSVSALTALWLARLDIDRQAASWLAGLTNVRLGLTRTYQHLGLAHAVLRVIPSRQPSPPGTIRIQTDAFGSRATLENNIRLVLSAEDDRIELATRALQKIDVFTMQSTRLLRAAEQAQSADIRQDIRHLLAGVESSLHALDIYLEILPDICHQDIAPETMSNLQTALKLDPANALLHLAQADILLLQHRPKEAAASASEALRLDPNLPRALYIRGTANLYRQLNSLSVSDLTRAIDLRPHKTEWRRMRAMALSALNDYPAMCADLYQLCVSGDCTELLHRRKLQQCLPQIGALPGTSTPHHQARP